MRVEGGFGEREVEELGADVGGGGGDGVEAVVC